MVLVSTGVVRQRLSVFLKILGFLKNFLKINPARIRSAICIDFLVGCVKYRIQFSIEWYHFQFAEPLNKNFFFAWPEIPRAVEEILFLDSAD